jgi:hypothetical protein
VRDGRNLGIDRKIQPDVWSVPERRAVGRTGETAALAQPYRLKSVVPV